MAPLKQKNATVILTRTGASNNQKTAKMMTTRNRPQIVTNPPRTKRKAECSPLKETGVKRSAMGDITNAKKNTLAEEKNKKATIAKKVTLQTKVLSLKTVMKPKLSENVPPQAPCLQGVVTRARNSITTNINQSAVTTKEPLKEVNTNRVKTRLSNEFEKTGESLYSSAVEELGTKVQEKSVSSISFVAQQLEVKLNLGNHEVPAGVADFDKENWGDVFQVSHYAMDIFNYLKSKENEFRISDYMDRQICLSAWMRSLLVDWMVEVQESFELNHETLYLGVKLVDMYLSDMTVGKETLQLVGAAAMFVASKYDERIPPLIDDFLYICDGAYSRRELVRMEINLLKVCDFNLGIPLSYRFLRRYARCGKVSMPVLTLARYVLELSLMDYTTVLVPDSILACASLFIALRMRNISGWTKTLEFYSGYKLTEIASAVTLLNAGLHRKPKSQLMTVRNKYSHKIFFEVAKIPLLTDDQLLL